MTWSMPAATILAHAMEIRDDFAADNLKLTLRQLYYQFVSRDLAPSDGSLDSDGKVNHVYKRIGEVLTAARYDGRFPVDGLEDRGRELHEGSFTRLPLERSELFDEGRELVRGIPSFLVAYDRWTGQRVHVSVWVEKDALAGVFESVCDSLGVSWMACRGYPSVSSLYEWLKHTYFAIRGSGCDDAGEDPDPKHTLEEFRRYQIGGALHWTERHAPTAERAVVLYFGDHDPDGWEIPRSAERNLRTLMETYNMRFDLTFLRIGLTMEQIRRYNPPPFAAKERSSRYASYIAEHGTTDAWELDALSPRVLRELVRTNVERYFDEYDRIDGNVEAERRELADEFAAALRDDPPDVDVDPDDEP